MYPDNFKDLSLEDLRRWRTKILADLHQAEQRAIMAGIEPEELRRISSISQTLGRVEARLFGR